MFNQLLFNKIARISIILVSITIPFWMILNNIAIIFASIISALNLLIYKKEKRVWYPIFNCYILLYILMTLSLLYTDNLKLGLTRMEQSLFFVLMPFIGFSLSSIIDKQLVFKSMKYFVWAVLLASLIFVVEAIKNMLYYASLNPFNEVNGNFFSYMKFTNVIEDTHPIYFGTYVLFSIFIFSNDYFKKDQVFSLNISVRVILFFFLILISFLLNSFLITGLLFLFLIYFFYKLFKSGGINKYYKLLLLVVLISSSLFSSTFISNKFKGVDLKHDIMSKDFSGEKFTAIKARIAKWDSSIDLILDNFWLGVGVGDERAELLKYYEKNGFLHGIERRFNSHNQYLTEFIYVGILGPLVLLYCFFVLFKESLIGKNYYLLSVGLIYLCFNLTESALVRNKGIVFFIFFSCLLFFYNNQNKLNKANPT